MKKNCKKIIGITFVVAMMASCSQEITSELVNQEPTKEEVKTLSAYIGNFKSEMMGEESIPQTRSTIVTDSINPYK